MKIKDSGERREFDTGAVRDIQEGVKGRCDLMPLDIVADLLHDSIIGKIDHFYRTSSELYLYEAINLFCDKQKRAMPDMLLEVSIHFSEGAKKYEIDNWKKGIPIRSYIDSAVRHYLKCLRGDNDEPHDRAFIWNLMCCAWTVIHKPEMNDLPVDYIPMKELMKDRLENKWQEQ